MGLLDPTIQVTFISYGDCYKCGVAIYGPESKQKLCKRDHNENFYCINGHGQVYVGETEAQKYKRLLEEEQSRHRFTGKRLEREENSHRATKGHLTRTRKRVGAGTCPCCKRTFQQLARHMKNKHPDYVESTSG